MPNITTSISNELFVEAQNKGIGWSKALKLGMEMCLKEGVDTFDKLRLENIKLKDDSAVKIVVIEELRKKNTDLKHRFIRKMIEIAMPDLHKSLTNKIKTDLNIEEIRAITGEKLGLLEISEAYDFEGIME